MTARTIIHSTSTQPVDLSKLPSIHATHPSERVSEAYGFIPTSTIVTALEREGFVPFKAQQARTRQLETREFAKHLIRFRHRDHLTRQVGDWLPEIVLVNAHDGSSAYRIMAGVFRIVCLNGLVVGQSFTDVRVRHTRNAPEEIVDASFRVIEALPSITDGIETMRAVTLESEERTAFAQAALVLRYGEDAPIRADQLITPRRNEDRGRDLWTVLNVAQEHLLRGGDRTTDTTRRTRTRKITGVSEDVRLNRALWTLAEEMARIKAA